MKNISIIVAIARNNAIGRNNELLWHISEDLKRFKRITEGHTVVMGRNTYLSLPKRPLVNRTNIVITDDINERFDGCITVHSIEEAVAACPENEECFVIGGGAVYRQFLPIAGKLYITHVHKDFEADTFFPEFDKKIWQLTENEDHASDEKHDFSYSFSIYIK
jgi:dihydrofolate reductase